MAEQRTEEQILAAFEKGSFGDSTEAKEQAPTKQDAQQPERAAQNAQVEGADAPSAEAEAAPAVSDENQEETQTIEIDPDEPLFEQELTENGQKKTQKLSLKELQQGYLRQADYTRKAQEVAKQRAEVQETARQAGQEAVKQYAQRLEQLQAALVKTVAPELANVDWNKLANEDAFEYVRLSNRAKQINDVLQAISSEKTTADEQSNQEQQKKKAENWSKSLDILKQDIPDWGAPVAKRLAQAAQDAGFTDAEVAQWDDHRLIKLAYKAAMAEDLQTKQPDVSKKVSLVPKILKPGTKPKVSGALDEARQQLKKTGRPEHALAIFEAALR